MGNNKKRVGNILALATQCFSTKTYKFQKIGNEGLRGYFFALSRHLPF